MFKNVWTLRFYRWAVLWIEALVHTVSLGFYTKKLWPGMFNEYVEYTSLKYIHNSEFWTPKVQEMYQFVVKWHKGQKRKYTGEPYLVHLLEVAQTVFVNLHWKIPADKLEHLILIALAHDVLEDTTISHPAFERIWGRDIYEDVLALSDLNTKGNRRERKNAYAKEVAKANSGVKLVKLADMMSNTKSIVDNDPNFAKVYLEEKHDLVTRIRLSLKNDVMKMGHTKLTTVVEHMVVTCLNQIERSKVILRSRKLAESSIKLAEKITPTTEELKTNESQPRSSDLQT